LHEKPAHMSLKFQALNLQPGQNNHRGCILERICSAKKYVRLSSQELVLGRRLDKNIFFIIRMALMVYSLYGSCSQELLSLSPSW